MTRLQDAAASSPPSGDLLSYITHDLGDSVHGIDSNDREYSSLFELWTTAGVLPISEPIENAESGQAWYEAAYDYWEVGQMHLLHMGCELACRLLLGVIERWRQKIVAMSAQSAQDEMNCPPTVNAVLGGHASVSTHDIATSQALLQRLRHSFPLLHFGRVLECGGGIGRVTKDVLLPEFAYVDLLEQSPRLLRAACDFIADNSGRVRFLCQGMQTYKPKSSFYDMIWIQWVIGQLHDQDLLDSLIRYKTSLTKSGLIIVKDNCCDNQDFVLDWTDRSLARSARYLKAIFARAGLECCIEEQVEGFPEDLFPIMLFCLTPASALKVTKQS